MTERFVTTAGTISVAHNASTVVGIGTLFAGRDRAGASVKAYPVGAVPVLVGTVAEVDPRGVYDNLSLPLVSPYGGPTLTGVPFELIDGPAIANGATQASTFARFSAMLEQNMGLAGNTSDSIDMSRVPNNTLLVDGDVLKQYRNGVLNDVSLSAGASTFTPTGGQQAISVADAIGGRALALRDFNAALSTQSTKGNISASSQALSVDNAKDFKNGQGIRVYNAGAPCTNTQPSALGVTPHGTTEATTYAYRLATVNADLGITAAIAAVTITNGNAALSATNYNALAWTAGNGAATLIWRSKSGGAYEFVAFTKGATFNDIGINLFAPPDLPVPAWIPATPPSSALGALLTTTIISGAGTTALNLTDAAGSTPPVDSLVEHDDSDALARFIHRISTVVGQITSGTSDNVFTTFVAQRGLIDDNARVLVSKPTMLGGVNLFGAVGRATIENINPFKRTLDSTFCYELEIEGIELMGGSNSLYLTNPNSNNGKFSIRRCSFKDSSDWAIKTVGCFSSRLELKENTAANCNGYVSSVCDENVFDDRWYEPGWQTLQPDRAWCEQKNTDYNQRFVVESFTGVPALHNGANNVVKARWFDICCQFNADECRFGGEGGGIPLVKVTSTLSTATSPIAYAGAVVSINDGWAWVESDSAVVLLDGIAAEISISGNRGPDGPPLIGEWPGFNFATALAAWKTATGVTDARDYIDYVIDRGAGRFTGPMWPASMNEYVRSWDGDIVAYRGDTGDRYIKVANTLSGTYGLAAFIAERGDANHGYALNYYETAGTLEWSTGLRADGTNTLHLARDEIHSIDRIVVKQNAAGAGETVVTGKLTVQTDDSPGVGIVEIVGVGASGKHWQIISSTDGSLAFFDATDSAGPLSITSSLVTFFVPVTLNADPASAMQAATKQYADARETNAKSYADGLVVGLIDDRGNFDASGNVFPSSGGSGSAGAILKGDLWFISVAGTLGSVAVNIGDQLRALVNTPGQTAGNWAVSEANIGYVPENVANKDTDGTLAANSDTKYASQKATKTYADTKVPKAISGLTTAAAAADADTIVTDQGAGALKQTLGAIKTWIKSWIVKADVGLGNVDNTSDANKPVSTAQQTALDLKAPLASPGLSGNPTAPTPSVDDNDTSIATTAFVLGQASASGDGTPAMDGTAARGTSTHFARADHIHPTDTSLAPKVSPIFTGTVTIQASSSPGAGIVEIVGLGASAKHWQILSSTDGSLAFFDATDSAGPLSLTASLATFFVPALFGSTVTLNADPTLALQAATKQYADARETAAKSYADGLVVGLIDDRGNFDASGNVFPSSGGSGSAGAILKGDLWLISVAGTLGSVAVNIGDQLRALTNTPGQTAGNWAVSEANIGYVPENSANKDTDGTLAANSDTKYASQKATKTYADTKVPKAISGLTTAAAAADADTIVSDQGAGALKQTLGAIKTWIKAWIVQGDVGLGNVNNTSDANKPVSTAQQAALDLKSPITSPIFQTDARFDVGSNVNWYAKANTGVPWFVAADDSFSGYVAGNIDANPLNLNVISANPTNFGAGLTTIPSLVQRPGASVTPANNGDLMVQATSNTQITFKLKGSDGTVRSGSITLS